MEKKRREFTKVGLFIHCLFRLHRSYRIISPSHLKRRGCLTCEGLEDGSCVAQDKPKDVEEMLEWANITIIEMGLDDRERDDGGMYAHFIGDEDGPYEVGVRTKYTAWAFGNWPALSLYLEFIHDLDEQGITNAQALDHDKYDAAYKRMKGGE